MSVDRLLVFAKAPRPGAVKTRLSPPLAPAEAMAVHEACVRDVIARAARERGRIELWHDGADGAAAWCARSFPRLPAVRQASGHLGLRLADAFRRSFAGGAERVVILGGDVPTLPDAILSAAFDDLVEADAVVGPSADGGYVLIGLARRGWPNGRDLFRDVDWSTATVLATTLERANTAGLDLRVLPGWYDVDRKEDLDRAAVDAEPDSHLGRWLAGRTEGR